MGSTRCVLSPFQESGLAVQLLLRAGTLFLSCESELPEQYHHSDLGTLTPVDKLLPHGCRLPASLGGLLGLKLCMHLCLDSPSQVLTTVLAPGYSPRAVGGGQ